MLNTDDTISLNSNIGGLGGVFRSSMGEWILGFTAITIIHDISELETLALFIGLQLAMKYTLEPLQVNVDVVQLPTMLNSTESDTNFSSLLCDYRFLLRQLGSPNLVYIYREQNRLADSLARRAISTSHLSNISTSFAASDAVTSWSPPPELDVLNANKRGDFTTRCVKTVGALPPSTSVHTPSNAMLGITIGWPVNIAQGADTMVTALPNHSL
ncbi:hypothetical protein P3L10_006947 [Capsicum annuum]